MDISLRWGGGGCHGDMSTKPSSRSKVKDQRSGLFIYYSKFAKDHTIFEGKNYSMTPYRNMHIYTKVITTLGPQSHA